VLNEGEPWPELACSGAAQGMVGSAAPSRTMHRIAPLSDADMDDPGRPPRGGRLEGNGLDTSMPIPSGEGRGMTSSRPSSGDGAERSRRRPSPDAAWA
jgi:hypothetical protein